MKRISFETMSTDELWNLHEQVISKLDRCIAEKKAKLEERLHKLESAQDAISSDRQRRPYPKVHPKYRNPQNPAETWSGRGKQPRWVQAQLKAGKKLEKFLIAVNPARSIRSK